MKICITGISSFVGQSLANECVTAGHSVFGTSTIVSKLNAFNCVQWSLDVEPRKEWFKDVDVVVHLAWDVRPGQKNKNVAGTLRFAELAKQSGVRRQIFVSSCSAHERAQSEYGIGKFECEKYFLGHRMNVIRPGLVIGNGGGFKNLIDYVQKNKLIPLIDGGGQRIPVIGLDDLTQYLIYVIDSEPASTIFKSFYWDSPQFKTILTTIGNLLDKKILFISVNSWIILKVLKLAAIFRLALPVSKEQVIGYISNKDIDLRPTSIDFIDLKKDIKSVMTVELSKLNRTKNLKGN
jgi:nucleoside-diphosphate-sugar epimerase